jgi:hypothetical protein
LDIGAAMAAPKRKATKPKGKAAHTTVNIKASEEWKAWVERLAKHCRTDIAKLVDSSLIARAKAEGFDEEAPER